MWVATDSDHILSLCFKLFPAQKEGGDNAFFQNAARVIFFGIWSSLTYRHGKDFTFRDVYLAATSDIATQRTILEGYAQGQQILDIFFDTAADKTLDNIRMQLFTEIERFAPVAAHCQRAGSRTISLEKFQSSEGVIIIRQDLSALEASKPFVQAFFERYVERINAQQGHEYPPSDFIFADELEFLELIEIPALRKAATFSRKKGLVLNLATQTIGGLYRKGNKEDADTILGCCPYKAMFRTECAETAAWGVSQFGRKEITEQSYSKTYGPNGVSLSMGSQQQVRDVLQTGDFQNLPFPSKGAGLVGHFRSKIAGSEIWKCIPGDEIELLKPPTKPVPYKRVGGFNQPQPWTLVEREKYVSGRTTKDSESKNAVNGMNPFAAFDEALREEIFDITAEKLEQIICEVLERLKIQN